MQPSGLLRGLALDAFAVARKAVPDLPPMPDADDTDAAGEAGRDTDAAGEAGRDSAAAQLPPGGVVPWSSALE